MHEHIARVLYYADIHLVFASFVGLAAWAFTWVRPLSATVKYWIWVATALNFILPTGALLDKLGAPYLLWAKPLGVIGDAANGMSQGRAGGVLFGVWLVGAVMMFARLWLRIRSERRAGLAVAHESDGGVSRNFFAAGIPVRFAGSRQGPAVSGVLRPHISLPSGIERLLSEQELNAVLIHELTHARRKDNLIRLVYEVGFCVLWFHPLVWIAGARLALYRELSCDESVIQRARGRELVSALAKLASPEEAFLLEAAAGASLRQRIERLTAAQPKRASLAASAMVIVLFGAVVMCGVFETVAHTACCFVHK